MASSEGYPTTSESDPPVAPTTASDLPVAPTPAVTASSEVLARWDNDIQVMREGIRLLLSNQIAEANVCLEKGAEEVKSRGTIDFAAGDHDLRGGFAFVNAIMSLMQGMASLENNQLQTVLERIWVADDLLVADGAWAGRTVMRGLCLMLAGVVELMQQSYAKGVWHICRSWLWLRYLEAEGLNFEGHEREAVRSTSLLALGVFNLLVSILPPSAMQAAGWLSGFSGGRKEGEEKLRCCWQEDGILAPFAGLILVGVAADVSSFLGELDHEREPKLEEASKILKWGDERYPNAFFFAGLKASYLCMRREIATAGAIVETAQEQVKDLPAFVFITHLRLGTMQACALDWSAAAISFRKGVDIYRSVNRRAFCPTLSMNAYFCHLAAGEAEQAATALELARSYRTEDKKWGGIDEASLEQAELVHSECSSFRPLIILYQKVGVIYRGGHFMSDEVLEKFIGLIQAEKESCDESNVDCRAQALMILSEVMRQRERWDDALQASEECLQLKAMISKEGIKIGSVQVAALVAAFSHYAKGNMTAAQDMLRQLDKMGGNHFFKRNVSFKATHLRRLVGLEMQSAFTEVTVGARSILRFRAHVPEDAELLEWDFVLAEHSISMTVEFNGEVLTNVQKHEAEDGPISGSVEVKAAGVLEVVVDNSFSLLRSKKLQYRLTPDSVSLSRV